MTRRRRGTLTLAACAAVTVLTAACGASATETTTAGLPAAAPTVNVEPTPTNGPLTSTVSDLSDEAAAADAGDVGEGSPQERYDQEGSHLERYDQYVASVDPLPPDGGTLVDCADVPVIEPAIEGTPGSLPRIDADVDGVLTTYWMEHLETFGGWWRDLDHGVIVLAFTDDPAGHREAILARSPSEDDLGRSTPITDPRPLGERDDVFVDVVQVQHTEAALRATMTRGLADVAWADYGMSALANGLDRNRLELALIDPPEGALDELALLLPTAAMCVDVTRSPERPTGPLDVIPDLAVDDPLVICAGAGPFPYSAFTDPVPVDEVDHPAIDALRRHIDEGLRPRLRDRAWAVLSIEGDVALFAEFRPRRFEHTTFVHNGDRWVVDGWGSSGGACKPEVALPEGLNLVAARLDPAALPSPADTTISLLVTEWACASGREMGDDLLDPQIVETETSVLVAFAAVASPLLDECPGNPSTAVTIELQTPLGDRELLDGLHLPPRPITEREH